jgi:uncharacterized membrane protein YkoI
MPASRLIPILLACALWSVPALAAEPVADASCLSKAEQRAAVAEHKAIPLARAMRNRREKGHFATLLRARLCHREEKLVYMLTLLARSGRVISETVDASNGDVISGR